MSEVMPFQFQDNQVRVVMVEDKPWFVAKDICDVLEHTNSRMALDRLKDYEKGVTTVYTRGGNQEMAIISESGLYRLILTSRKPQAEPFQDWVCQEVIPSISKTGSYALKPKTQIQLIVEMAQALANQEQTMLKIQLEQQLQAEKLAEIEALAHQHDGEIDRIFNPNGHYFTVMGYFAKFLKEPVSTAKARVIGKRCTKYCNENGIEIQKLTDPRYGDVGSYPENVVKMFV